jgi:hypothetical protein
MKTTVCAAALAVALTGPAHAMTYSWREIAGDKLIVFASGEITPEDVRTFSSERFDGSCDADGDAKSMLALFDKGCTKIRARCHLTGHVKTSPFGAWINGTIPIATSRSPPSRSTRPAAPSALRNSHYHP